MPIDIEFTPNEIHSYVAARGLKLKKQGRELRGPCPIHHGKRDSFAINPTTGLWHCHSECGRGGSLIGLEIELTGKSFKSALTDVFRVVGRPEPNGTGESKRRELYSYDYTDEDGKLLFQVVRYYPKDFRQRHPDPTKRYPNGDPVWIWNMEGVPRVLYRLHRLKDAEQVLVAEGERDVNTLERLGFVATCNPMGAGKWLDAYSDKLAGKGVVIFPDNDEEGRKHVEQVARSLKGKARSVTVVTVAQGKDVSDWINNGATREIIADAIRTAQSSKDSDAGDSDDLWPEPEDLGAELPPVLPFDLDMLPAVLRPLVEDTAERMQVPADFPGVISILCEAGVVGRRAVIRPKDADGSWVVVPNLWGAIVASPGLMKSPTISTMMKPLNAIEAVWRAEHDSLIGEYGLEKEKAELEQSAWREEYKRAKKQNKVVPIRPDDSLAEPVMKRLIVYDSTPEKLHELLNANPAGLLLVRDELSGMLAEFEKVGREGERQFFLMCWNGDSPYTVDRIGRGTVHVDACCLSILGGIPPARLRSYLVEALRDGPSNDGLFQRFQLLVYPDMPKTWSYVNRPPNHEAIRSIQAAYESLSQLDAGLPLHCCFDRDAQELFVVWLTELEGKLRSNEMHPAMVSHLAKYRSLMPSLALLFELIEGNRDTTVSLAHTQQAAAFCEYLESHARRVYSMIISPAQHAAQELGRHLIQGWRREEGIFTVRDVYRNEWSGLTTPEEVRAACEILADAGWIREIETPNRMGRPSEKYAINPKLGRKAHP